MRPFTFINVAASADGKISSDKIEQVRISSEEDMLRVDTLRASSDAILVGIGTVISDNPRLTVKNGELRKKRLEKGLSENPIRVVADSSLRIPEGAEVLNQEALTIVAISENIKNEGQKKEKEKIIKKSNTEIVAFGGSKVDLRKMSEYLYSKGVRTLMVEGGGTLNRAMLAEKLVDEFYIYYGNVIIGGMNAPSPVDGYSFFPPIKLEIKEVKKLGTGVLSKWKVIY